MGERHFAGVAKIVVWHLGVWIEAGNNRAQLRFGDRTLIAGVATVRSWTPGPLIARIFSYHQRIE